MKAHKLEVPMTDETRLALLEQSISHINETMLRMEKRFDSIENNISKGFDKVDSEIREVKSEIKTLEVKLESKMDSHFKWIIGIIFGACTTGFITIVGFFAHVVHWI